MAEFSALQNSVLEKTGFSNLPTEIQDMIFDLIILPVTEGGVTWAPNGWLPHGSQVFFRKLTYLQTGMVSCLPRHATMHVSRLWRSAAMRGFWRNGACKLQIGWKQERTSGSVSPSARSREIDLTVYDHWIKNIKYLSLEALDWTNDFTNWEIKSLFKRSLPNLQYLHLGVERLPQWKAAKLSHVLDDLPWVQSIAKHPTLKYFSVSRKPEWKTWYPISHYTNDPSEDLGVPIIEHYVRISIKARDIPGGIESWSDGPDGCRKCCKDLDLFAGDTSAGTRYAIFATLHEMFANEGCWAGFSMCNEAHGSLRALAERERDELRLARMREQEAEARRREARARRAPGWVDHSEANVYRSHWSPRGSGPIDAGGRFYRDDLEVTHALRTCGGTQLSRTPA